MYCLRRCAVEGVIYNICMVGRRESKLLGGRGKIYLDLTNPKAIINSIVSSMSIATTCFPILYNYTLYT